MSKEQAQALCSAATFLGRCWFIGEKDGAVYVVPDEGHIVRSYAQGLAKLARIARRAELAASSPVEWA